MLCLFDFPISLRASVKRITEHYEPKKQSTFSVLQLLLMLWWLFVVHQNVSVTGSHINIHLWHETTMSSEYFVPTSTHAEFQDSKKYRHFDWFIFMTKQWMWTLVMSTCEHTEWKPSGVASHCCQNVVDKLANLQLISANSNTEFLGRLNM